MMQVNFIMICIIYKIYVLLKITRILKHFLRSFGLLFLKKQLFFSRHIMMENPRSEEENITKDARNLFRF